MGEVSCVEEEPEEVLGRKYKLKMLWRRKKRRIVAAVALSVIAIFLVAHFLFGPGPPVVIGPVFPQSGWGFLGVIDENNGVEGVYLAPRGTYGAEYNPRMDMAKQEGKLLGKIESSGQGITIQPDKTFDIVIAVRIEAPKYIGVVSRENFCMELELGGSLQMGPENSTDQMEIVFESSGYRTGRGYMRVNVVWDNDGNGFVLHMGEKLEIKSLRVYTWTLAG